MAKKTSNPADAFRKQQRAKEVKKNKEARAKVRETQTIKRDTRELEADIRHLKTQTDAASKTRLAEVQKELDYIIQTKEKYVSEHPEARDKVFRPRGPPRQDGEGGGPSSGPGGRGEDLSHLYDENGRLRDPKKSVYYDPTYNPFGVPPPGMPYRERTQEEESEEEDEDDEEDSDDEIVMPEGPPPKSASDSEDDSDDSDDIPLPEGPPPPRALPPPVPTGPRAGVPMPMGFPPRPPPFFPSSGMAMPMGMNMGGPSHFRPPIPRPHPPPGGRMNVPHNRPPANVQDPLSDAPTQTYQGYRMGQQHALPARPPAPGAISAAPTTVSAGPSKPPPEAATISAAPVLRDLRKEATVFVPRGVKKRKGPGGGPINAAPGAGEIDEDGDERKNRTSGGGGLLGKLEGVLGGVKTAAPQSGGGADDDYQKFLEGLGDLA
ncbi:hypothetical protein CI109_101687 [Kwoniella shandongensis]|uniref:Wbp11/ELF5/Saf1 N-terminal domain-containing protein n=1 Tax=Kwoniella shandongensis TaxID=1734106 RepID=A0A5M6C5G5_9TREE|nr:uncharacterized protein CI109_001189 [Kwoniella shandongensis]KAA5530386.1 hypothetical protein CI109_001189 [Kwoniella shandongensis]